VAIAERFRVDFCVSRFARVCQAALLVGRPTTVSVAVPLPVPWRRIEHPSKRLDTCAVQR